MTDFEDKKPKFRMVNGVKVGKREKTEKKINDAKYPFESIEVGEYFWFSERDISINTMRCRAYQRGVALGRKFSVNRREKTVERVA